MRKRIEGLGVNAEIQRSGANKIVVGLPDTGNLPNASNATRAREVVGKTGQLYFYDWEPNVIGPSGKPAPSEATVTGGSTAGGVETGLLEYQAVLLAAKRPAILRENDTTWSAGCTPEQKKGCIYGSWYLLDTKHEKVLGGPEETERSLYANSYKPSAGATVAIVLDNQVLTAPSIDYTKYPEGIDAADGSEISGSFTTTSAQNLADELRYGVLPLKLVLIARGGTYSY